MNWHIHISGQVQGVGFRPFVFLLAKEFNLKGWVNNTTDGVHIEFNADHQTAHKAYKTLIETAPALSRIIKHSMIRIAYKEFQTFEIIHSTKSESANLLMTPDFAMCEDCKNELHEPKNRRHGYPFITCTNCGPRYSIIHSLPYDREHTKMDVFRMCPRCRTEYDEPVDRRYYSQTNSCPDCPIELNLHDKNQNLYSSNQSDILGIVVKAWEKGEIVAIKGIGGYLLTCDATQGEAISNLRIRKYRPSKPFALMFPDLETLCKEVSIQADEKKELQSHIAPIVLLETKPETKTDLSVELIAPALNQVGVMLPYTPLYQILLDQFNKPIVATSGNISNSPIIFEDDKALNELTSIADYVLSHNRDIVVPQDDSVIKFSPVRRQKVILRRSRGWAPTYIQADLNLSNQSILATGAMLKSTFCLLHEKNTYISQYLGDLEQFDTQQSYRLTVKHLLGLFNARPEIILADKHPEYASTRFAMELSEQLNIPLLKFQHHVAHFAAVLGEHNLLHQTESILGVIWDGTGLGDDKNIWGGEFFTYQSYDFARVSQFAYFDFILGDKMPREPRISALSLCNKIKGTDEILKKKFTHTEWKLYSGILESESKIKTSSLGRIFDAVASILEIMDIQTFEGEAAMRLESIASEYIKMNGTNNLTSYLEEKIDLTCIPTQSIIRNLIRDKKAGKSKSYIAAKFHFTLVSVIEHVAQQLGINKIAFSGGVFQNCLLVDLIIMHLGSKYDLFFHDQLSPNDECISFGQLICHEIQRRIKS